MAKIAQLIEAGDYLVYKGDWATNTAYDVNEVVTGTDGQLYEVIKAHTSSNTLKPSNTGYYKAMTNIAIKSARYATNNATQRTNAINLIKAKRNRIIAIHVNDDENSVWHCDNINTVLNKETALLSNIDFTFDDFLLANSIKIKMLGIYASGVTTNTLTINTDGTINNDQNATFSSITIYYI